jgi:hypothetical protein
MTVFFKFISCLIFIRYYSSVIFCFYFCTTRVCNNLHLARSKDYNTRYICNERKQYDKFSPKIFFEFKNSSNYRLILKGCCTRLQSSRCTLYDAKTYSQVLYSASIFEEIRCTKGNLQ